ncbi:hypothetical protein SAMN06265784_111138 [Paraburkholderia susongensis]|uniref:Uncharacterized protein n=1 Tax=Paraburkholderia susongensis TaxID=1515439 RepID=A0A1X7LXN3_9BURK|nr:hypothetical protein SAMN06265784_111138 [Paraburkholderia susongensis]
MASGRGRSATGSGKYFLSVSCVRKTRQNLPAKVKSLTVRKRILLLNFAFR